MLASARPIFLGVLLSIVGISLVEVRNKINNKISLKLIHTFILPPLRAWTAKSTTTVMTPTVHRHLLLLLHLHHHHPHHLHHHLLPRPLAPAHLTTAAPSPPSSPSPPTPTNVRRTLPRASSAAWTSSGRSAATASSAWTPPSAPPPAPGPPPAAPETPTLNRGKQTTARPTGKRASRRPATVAHFRSGRRTSSAASTRTAKTSAPCWPVPATAPTTFTPTPTSSGAIRSEWASAATPTTTTRGRCSFSLPSGSMSPPIRSTFRRTPTMSWRRKWRRMSRWVMRRRPKWMCPRWGPMRMIMLRSRNRECMSFRNETV